MATKGRARAGSRLQMQIYVNERARDLTNAVQREFPELGDSLLEWVSPREESNFREFRDGAFLKALGLERFTPHLKEFWPARGPVWDGLAVGGDHVILAEAKSYPEEFYSGGCKAEADASLVKIREALAQTQSWLDTPVDPDKWMLPLKLNEPSSSLYQSANRYAHLFFLREVVDVNALLVHVLFENDQTFKGASQAVWEAHLPVIEEELGLRGVRVPFAGHIFLPAAATP